MAASTATTTIFCRLVISSDREPEQGAWRARVAEVVQRGDLPLDRTGVVDAVTAALFGEFERRCERVGADHSGHRIEVPAHVGRQWAKRDELLRADLLL